MFVRSFAIALTATFALTGCDLIEAALAEHPDDTQQQAMGDIFAGVGAFIAVVSDPAGAADGDFADLHATAPYQRLLDPARAPRRRRGEAAGAPRIAPQGCVVATGGGAAWSCDFIVDGVTCSAIGSGVDNGDGTYSGQSAQCCPAPARDPESGQPTQSCAESGGVEVVLTATKLIFDEAAGTGGGSLTVAVQDHGSGGALVDLASVTLDGVGFCTDEPTPAPNSGSMTVDGHGPLEGTPYDPITLEFTDVPECGVINIK